MGRRRNANSSRTVFDQGATPGDEAVHFKCTISTGNDIAFHIIRKRQPLMQGEKKIERKKEKWEPGSLYSVFFVPALILLSGLLPSQNFLEPLRRRETLGYLDVDKAVVLHRLPSEYVMFLATSTAGSDNHQMSQSSHCSHSLSGRKDHV